MVDVPVCAVHRRYERRCDHAATLGLLLEVPQFSSSPEFVDLPVCTETGAFIEGLVAMSVGHFSRSSGSSRS